VSVSCSIHFTVSSHFTVLCSNFYLHPDASLSVDSNGRLFSALVQLTTKLVVGCSHDENVKMLV
jgi:hypothetical protein